MAVARKFYGKFLPQLGFVEERPGKRYHTFYSAGGDKPSEFFGFTQNKNHKPNGTRIAFWADTRKEVDRLAKLVRKAGGKTLEELPCRLLCILLRGSRRQQAGNLLPRASDHCEMT